MENFLFLNLLFSLKMDGSYPNKKRHLYLKGKRWFYRMKAKFPNDLYCLFTYFPEETLENKVLIGMESQSKSKENGLIKHIRLYSVFEDYIELYRYLLKFDKDHRFFYEIILGDVPQKPHFDLDLPSSDTIKDVKDANKILQDVIRAIEKVCAEYDVKMTLEKDVLVYHSHGSFKFSYHIVIHHWCHSNHIQAKGFYEKVLEKCSSETKEYLDQSVYSSKQNFRLLSSQKIGSGRPKKTFDPFPYNDQEVKHILDVEPESPQHASLEKLKESLVSWISDCRYLPDFVDESKTTKYLYNINGEIRHSHKHHDIIIPNEILNIVQAFLHDKNYPFEVRELEGNCIALQRLAPSYCEVCERIHEHENPYIIVQGNEIYLNCRRSSVRQLLTVFSENLIEPTEESEELLEPDEIYIDNEKASQLYSNDCESESNDHSENEHNSSEDEEEEESGEENGICKEEILNEIASFNTSKEVKAKSERGFIHSLYTD